MKLRIRSSETRETIRVEISSSSSLRDLKALIAGRVTSEATPVSPDAVHLSLNRRDELTDSLPEDTLQTLGLASGDLIFYTVELSGFSQPSSAPALGALAPRDGVGLAPQSGSEEEVLVVASTADGEEASIEKELVTVKDHMQESMEMSMENVSAATVLEESMELDSERPSTYAAPRFLKRVVEGVQARDREKSDLDILVIAVHAVFLESGFVEYDCPGARLSEGWASTASTISISYTLPEIRSPNFPAAMDKAELKILLVGKFADVYGYLSGDSYLHRLCLDATKFVPSILAYINSMSEKDEKTIFELWRSVKDEISLPLLMDMCFKNGLPPPPCFICLPTELKTRVLELLPGVDLARAAGVNSELRYLSSNEDLWKQKFMEEFSGRQAYGSRGNLARRWKDKFAAYWEDQKRNKRHRVVSSIYQYAVPPVRRRDRAPFPAPLPNVLGGDYDLFPAFGNAYHGRSRQARSPFLRGQSFSPPCNLGGFNA